MKCEKCGKEHNGDYGSGRFCNSKCARGFSTTEKRKEINIKVSKLLSGYRCVKGGKIKLCDYGCGQKAKYQLSNGKWCCEPSYNQCLSLRKKNSQSLRKVYKGRRKSYTVNQDALDRAHKTYRKNLQKKYDQLPFHKKPDGERRKIVLKEQDNKCLICGTEQWQDKPLKLHLDHIDGHTQNNSRENLRFLCPNCHSQTPTYCQSGDRKGKLYGQKVSDKKLIKAIIKTKSPYQALLKCGLTAGANYNRVNKLMDKHKLTFKTTA